MRPGSNPDCAGRRTSLAVLLPALIVTGLLLIGALGLLFQNLARPVSPQRWVVSALLVLASAAFVAAIFRELARRVLTRARPRSRSAILAPTPSPPEGDERTGGEGRP